MSAKYTQEMFLIPKPSSDQDQSGGQVTPDTMDHFGNGDRLGLGHNTMTSLFFELLLAAILDLGVGGGGRGWGLGEAGTLYTTVLFFLVINPSLTKLVR